jgi:hypothetical protein
VHEPNVRLSAKGEEHLILVCSACERDQFAAPQWASRCAAVTPSPSIVRSTDTSRPPYATVASQEPGAAGSSLPRIGCATPAMGHHDSVCPAALEISGEHPTERSEGGWSSTAFPGYFQQRRLCSQGVAARRPESMIAYRTCAALLSVQRVGDQRRPRSGRPSASPCWAARARTERLLIGRTSFAS